MIYRPLSEHAPGPSVAQKRKSALQSAIILRDCSFRDQSTGQERRACRTLMRRQAAQWRQPCDAGL
jgi:hypothetical protein